MSRRKDHRPERLNLTATTLPHVHVVDTGRNESHRHLEVPSALGTPRERVSSSGLHTPRIEAQNLPSAGLHLPYISQVAQSQPPTPSWPRHQQAFNGGLSPLLDRRVSRRSEVVGPVGEGLAEATNHEPRPRQKASELKRGCVTTNRHLRPRIVTSVLYGTFVVFIMAMYLVTLLSNRRIDQEYHIIFILSILITAFLFLHSLLGLYMTLKHPSPNPLDVESHARPPAGGPSGYAEPVVPIPVALARDEEAVGIESDATKVPPPAYGLWRDSVRVDPNRIFWKRNSARPSALSGARTDGSAPRPPSYASEDGVGYALANGPRSALPSPMPIHPSELGRLEHLGP